MIRTSTIPLPRGSAWGWKNEAYTPEEFYQGVIRGDRGPLGTRLSMPSASEIRAIGRLKMPFWQVLNYDLQAQATGDNAVAARDNFIAMALVATSTQGIESPGKGFRTQFRQLTDENGNAANFNDVGIEQDNMFGDAQNAFYFSHPFRMPNLLQLMNRCQNKMTLLDPNAGENVIQICIIGVQDR